MNKTPPRLGKRRRTLFPFLSQMVEIFPLVVPFSFARSVSGLLIFSFRLALHPTRDMIFIKKVGEVDWAAG